MKDLERREHVKSNYRSRFAKSTVDITCPFCETTTTCYIWSLAGGGKKCSCGALHTNYYTVEPYKIINDKRVPLKLINDAKTRTIKT